MAFDVRHSLVCMHACILGEEYGPKKKTKPFDCSFASMAYGLGAQSPNT